MRIALDPRAQRLLRRVPRTNVYTVLELVLLSLLAVQCARLVWTLVTPVGPVGEWRAAGADRLAAGPAGILGSFDPFFRLDAQSGLVTVTSLNLKLYGIRQDQASGRGSAIIATPDGEQRSFAVGEEIVPGVTLAAVDFDSVTLSRGGVSEQLFMDQSPTAAVVGPAAVPAPVPAPAAPAVMVPPAPQLPPRSLAGVGFQPRMNAGRVTGVAVQPQGSGEAFRAAGFVPGDVIVAVDGRPIRSPDEVRSLGDRLGAGLVTVQVERGGKVIRMQVRNGQ
jgi:general secretion pathway protein C